MKIIQICKYNRKNSLFKRHPSNEKKLTRILPDIEFTSYIVKINYSPITTVDVDCSFIQYKKNSLTNLSPLYNCKPLIICWFSLQIIIVINFQNVCIQYLNNIYYSVKFNIKTFV